MPRTQVERAFGTQAQIAAFTPASGEFIYDSDRDTIVVGDGATLGGFVVAAPHLANTFSRVQTITPPVNESALVASGFSLTGAAANSILDLSGTWNTAGDPSGIKLNITNTASGASALLLDLQRDGLSRMTVRKSGFQTLLRQEADVNISGLEISKRGNAGSATGALSSGSGIGGLDFRGYDGVAFAGAGSLRSFTTQAWAAGAHGSSFVFSLVPIGSTVETAVATLSGAGGLTLTGQLLLPNTTSATVGGIYFGGNRAFHNFGTNNTFAGVNAGNFTLTGTSNSFFGTGVGAATTTGSYNSFFGFQAGLVTTSGLRNSFFGVNTGMANIGGSEGSFFGTFAGQANTSGGYNSFFGRSAGAANTTGSNNVFFGYAAGKANTTASNNSFFGSRAGLVSTGAYNSFFGRDAGIANTSGASNNFFGRFAGAANNTGSSNCFFGLNAGLLSTTGSSNIIIGNSAADNLTTGSSNLFIGFNIDAPIAAGSNQMSIGNLIFGTGVDGTGTTISSGSVGIAVVTPLDRLHVGGRLRVDTGFFNDAGGFKHARVTTGSVGAGATALVTITWATAFADTNYTVNASVLDATTSSLSLSVVHVETITAAAVTVRVLNNAIGALTGTVHVIAVHD